MARNAQEVTDAELAVLQVLWEQEGCPIRVISQTIYPRGGASEYATVQKLLERLEGKGFVRRDRSQSVHLFWAAVGREDLIGRRLRDVAEKLCGGSLTPLLNHLVKAEKLSAHERKSLRALVDELDAKRPGRK